MTVIALVLMQISIKYFGILDWLFVFFLLFQISISKSWQIQIAVIVLYFILATHYVVFFVTGYIPPP